MENQQLDPATQKELAGKIQEYAANQLINGNKHPEQVKEALVAKGLDETTAHTVVENLRQQISDAKRSGAQKDMLWGAVWCVGGIIATAANIGFIFWGAIVFGAIQFFKGVANLSSND